MLKDAGEEKESHKAELSERLNHQNTEYTAYARNSEL